MLSFLSMPCELVIAPNARLPPKLGSSFFFVPTELFLSYTPIHHLLVVHCMLQVIQESVCPRKAWLRRTPTDGFTGKTKTLAFFSSSAPSKSISARATLVVGFTKLTVFNFSILTTFIRQITQADKKGIS